jgi:CRISPR-associated endonuclease/helicase Cas3
MAILFAHSENKYNQKHTIKEHLIDVTKNAYKFAGRALWRNEAALAGQLHDLGKYADLFQARLRGEEGGLDHWSAGAWVALKDFQSVAAALAVQGHHIGLQQGNKNALSGMNPAILGQHHPLNLRLSSPIIGTLKARATEDGLDFSKPDNCIINPSALFKHPIAAMLDVRMLFSCLTDADFIDTEAHFEGDTLGKNYRQRGPNLDVPAALQALDDFMVRKIRKLRMADSDVLNARNSLWRMVTKSAANDPGLFTLTAPTGSGKTLAMLKFALEHAGRNNLKRIILAVPFLSITEQTAAIYRAVFEQFPAHFVLEHHSLSGLGCEEAATDTEVQTNRIRRLLSENWDSPIIITTNVQLLESLFSNRPSTCRKLHRLMEAVILFDEAQTLPQSLAIATIAGLSHLSSSYGTTVLFATATQPAFNDLHEAVKMDVPSGWQAVEAAPEHAALYSKLRRYDVDWPQRGETKEWTVLANEIRQEAQVLCVVNLKRHADTLLDELKNDAVFHLSTNLCALHRRAVLDTVRNRLLDKKPCRLVSTQCIEAGVDVDFPVVYRSLAPLEAIAQAAGRCNREGRLTNEAGAKKMGVMRVFEPAIDGDYRKRYPTYAYFQAAEVTRSMLLETGAAGIDLNDPSVFLNYFRRLYDLSKPEAQNIELTTAISAIDFVQVAKAYRLINQAAIQVLVPYIPFFELFEELQREQEVSGISAKWMRRAQGLAINVFRPSLGHPAWEVLIPAKLRYNKAKEVSDEWYILEDRAGDLYDDVLGLRLPQSQQIFIG